MPKSYGDISGNEPSSKGTELAGEPLSQSHLHDEVQGMGPIERVNLVAHLSLISQRLAQLEDRLKTNPNEGGYAGKSWLEFFKILLGGWPAFGLLFMLLFYIPVRDAINAIPEKVKSANEIGVLGVSLKNTIRVEAEKIGAIQLSETIPDLSPAAVEWLLRGSNEFNSLVAYGIEPGSQLKKSIWIPNEQTLKILEELENKKLIGISIDPLNKEDDSVVALRQEIKALMRKNPSIQDQYTGKDQAQRIELKFPIKEKISDIRWQWRPTDLGKNAINIILKAVSAQLTPSFKEQKRTEK